MRYQAHPIVTGFVSMAWNTAGMILPHRRGSCNPTIWLLYGDQLRFPLLYNKYVRCFGAFLIQFEIVMQKLPSETMLPVHLCGFQIWHKVKQHTTHRHTSYYYTTNHCDYLPRLECFWSRTSTYHNIAKLLIHLSKLLKFCWLQNFLHKLKSARKLSKKT